MSSTAQRSDAAPHYFCYACNREVPIYMAPDPTCQRCNEQFVQEIEAESEPQSFLNGEVDAGGDAADAGQDRPNAFFRYDSQNGNDLFQFLDALGPREGSEEPTGGNNDNRAPPAAMSNMLQNVVTMLLSQPGESPAIDQTSDEEGDGTRQPGSQQQPHSMLFYGGMVDGHLQFRPVTLSPQQQQQQQQRGEGDENLPGNNDSTAENAQPSEEEGAAAGDGARAGGDNRVNNFASLLRLLYGLSEGVVGNPNDYVFSQDGFDSIITQLMEQANGRNAPPPAPETVIETLPKRTLTEKEIADKTDCPVCKDEFGPTEEVNELPCQHVFHEDCIKPWLKVNGTCPVCRHSVLPEKKGEDTGSAGNDDTNTGADNGSSSSNNNNSNSATDSQATSNTNETPNLHAPTSPVEGIAPTISSLLGDPRRPLPSLAGWFSSYRSSNNQQQPSTSSPSSNTNDAGNSNDNNNTPQQPPSDSNNHNSTDHSEMDLDLD